MPEVLVTKDRELLTTILNTITNPKRRKDYESFSSGSGFALLKQLAAEVHTSSAQLGTWAAKQLAQLVDAGISDPSIVAFDQFREKYESFNDQLPKTRRHAPSVVAEAYAAAARELGEHIATRVDLKLEQRSASGDLDLTVKCLIEIVDSHTARVAPSN